MRPLPLLLALACAPPVDPPARPFPEGFQWGAATAGFQVDMGCPTRSDADCLDPASDWYQWVTTPEIVDDDSLYVTGEDVRHGPGMWELFEQDVARMKADGHTQYRMSLEWSRLFPTSAEDATTVEELLARANPDAVRRYHEQLAALADAGIAPLVTVNHYTLPTWVHDGVACHQDPDTCTASGWIDGPRITRLISLFAGFAGAEFGGEVDRWATLNEPFAITLSGYLQPGADRSNPPGLSFDGPRVVASLVHQIEAHAAMTDALRAQDTVDADADGDASSVGIVLNLVAMDPADPTRAADVQAVEHADHLYHRLFLEAVTAGRWDADLDGTFESTRPELADRLDWLGINYYNQMTVASIAPIRPLGDAIPIFDFLPTFTFQVPYTEGLRRVVELAAPYGRPMWITENGTPRVELGEEVLVGHLEALWTAVDAGADVRGYLYWSLVDNYEWNHGFDLRFGLYELDIGTKARTARPVLERYRTIVSRNGLDDAEVP